MKKNIFLYLFLLCSFPLLSQSTTFTLQDTLRGSVTPERDWWDLLFYDLEVTVDPDRKYIEGSNRIRYRVLDGKQVMQVDLQPPLEIREISQKGKVLEFKTIGNAHFINLAEKQKPGETGEIVISFAGHPKEAKNAPWDGGFSWSTDANGVPFIATSCQGLGASVWWPNKDHMYDEVDSMAIRVNVPRGLVGVANGRLKGVIEKEDQTTFDWYVSNPINNYGVNVNIGDYVHFEETYQGEKGLLDLSYYVLRDNLKAAREQFQQVPMMLEAFEHWFGPYPFYEDSFKLVEVPYLGMEHQSSVTYGNKYQNGYLGMDLSRSGWGLKFDFIIIHEAGHEWFANNITYKDIADMWIHEGFTAYSENLYLDYHYGPKASSEYVIGTRRNIRNDRPIIGIYGVNKRGSGDKYYKGANMLHTLRQLLEDDEKWRHILRGLNREFYHQTVTTEEIEDYISDQSGIDLTEFFEQYLRTTMVPVLEYKLGKGEIEYRYTQIVPHFDMPVRIFIGEEARWIFPKATWTKESIDGVEAMSVDKNIYIIPKEIKG